jgi:hypothetical protein
MGGLLRLERFVQAAVERPGAFPAAQNALFLPAPKDFNTHFDGRTGKHPQVQVGIR